MISVFNILKAAHCHGTHSYLAFSALECLQVPEKVLWKDFFLSQHKAYLRGSKAPDSVFKDFNNHVLHVHKDWGKAPEAAEKWYQKTVIELSRSNWREAAYAAGVLGHYVTDPLMAFHTDQSEAADNIHRALEHSVAKVFNELRVGIAEAGDDIQIVTSDHSENWLKDMLIAGAEFANQDYDLLVNEYNFEAGVLDPPAGLNVFCRVQLCEHLAYAQKLYAYVLDQAINAAGVDPPRASLGLSAVFGSVKIPVHLVFRKLTDLSEQHSLKAMYREYKREGIVDQNLPDKIRAIRDLLAKQKPSAEPIETIEQQTENSAVDSIQTNEPEVVDLEHLVVEEKVEDEPELVEVEPLLAIDEAGEIKCSSSNDTYTISNLVEIPSVGKRTASYLTKAGIHNVEEFLEADPYDIASKIDRDPINPETLQLWQYQAELKLGMPSLRSHDIQILVQSGYYSIEMIAECSPHNLLIDILPFVESEQGQKVIRSGDEPDFNEVEKWIELAVDAVGIEERSAA